MTQATLRRRWWIRTRALAMAAARGLWAVLRRVEGRDAIVLLGLGILARGVAALSPTAAWIVVGAVLVYLGLFHPLLYLHLSKREPK